MGEVWPIACVSGVSSSLPIQGQQMEMSTNPKVTKLWAGDLNCGQFSFIFTFNNVEDIFVSKLCLIMS